MLLTVFMRSLKIVKFLSQVLNLRLQLSGFVLQLLVRFGYRAEDEPAAS